MAARGENQWPPVGSSNGRPWGEPMAARGVEPMTAAIGGKSEGRGGEVR